MGADPDLIYYFGKKKEGKKFQGCLKCKWLNEAHNHCLNEKPWVETFSICEDFEPKETEAEVKK